MLYRAHPSVSSKRLEDELILVHLDTGFCFALEGVGVRIWELIEDGTTVQPLVETIASEYDVERERVVRDVDALMAEFLEHVLIVEEP